MHSKVRALLSALVVLTVFSSCSEKFDVMAPARPFTIVYGVLDAGDSANYVRIQRAFGNETQSALDLSKLSDSSFFPESSITVTFEKVGDTTTRRMLGRVKMSDEGYAKAPGDFFTMPNWAYKIPKSITLTPGATYRLLIKHNDNGNVDTAETAIVDLNNARIAEFDLVARPDQKVELTPTSNVDDKNDGTYSWQIVSYPNSNTVKFMNAIMRFNFVEKLISSGARTGKAVDYVFSTPVNAGNNQWTPRTFATDKFNNFYTAIVNGLGAAPAGTERLVDSSTLVAYFGSPELYLFQQNQTSSGGLGGDQIQYRYTNIRGKSVIGIFASRGKLMRRGVPLTDRTVAELKTNPNTKSCNITGRVTP